MTDLIVENGTFNIQLCVRRPAYLRKPNPLPPFPSRSRCAEEAKKCLISAMVSLQMCCEPVWTGVARETEGHGDSRYEGGLLPAGA